MPGYSIHSACGIKALQLAEKYASEKCPDIPLPLFSNDSRKKFMTGTILPDAAKLALCKDVNVINRRAHYAPDKYSYFKTPDMELFVKKHRISPDEPLNTGYALHLYLDIQYEKYIKGIATFTAGTVSEAPHFEQRQPDKTIKTISCADFWHDIYEDYTKLNPYYKEKYGFEISDFLAVDEFTDAESTEQISWYRRLYDEVSDMFGKADEDIADGRADILRDSTVTLKSNEIDALISKSVNDFLKKYLYPVLDEMQYKLSHTENVHEADVHVTENVPKQKGRWQAEQLKLDYYIRHWGYLVENGCVDKVDEDFFDGVIQEIRDVSRSANTHRKKHSWYTALTTYTLPVMITLASAVFTAFSSRNSSSAICLIFGIISTTLSALLTAVTNLSEVLAHRETWLRQRLYYSVLMEETESFCERIAEYTELDDSLAVRRYMDNIRRLRKKDYSNFFTNMGCTNFEEE